MSFLTYDTADDIITSLEIIEKLLFPGTDFWHDNYLNDSKTKYFSQLLTKILRKKSRFQSFLEFRTTFKTINIFELFSAYNKGKLGTYQKYFDRFLMILSKLKFIKTKL